MNNDSPVESPIHSSPPHGGIRGWTLSEVRWLRYLTLCTLYFAQGIPWGFVSIALIATLNERDVSKEQTGALLSLSVLPWTFKIFWGPIIDSYRLQSFGQRRPWIVLAQLMMALTLLIAFAGADLTTESTLFALGAVFFTHNCFASLQDVATDALAVDLLTDSERGRVNGFMWGSKLLGISIGGAGMVTVIARWNLDTGMRVMAATILVIMLLPLLIPERPGDKRFPWSRVTAAARSHARAVRTGPVRVALELFRAYGTRTTGLALVIALFAMICEGLSVPLTSELYVATLGWTSEQFGHAQGVYGTIGLVLGALCGGYLCDRLGARRMVVVGMSLTALTYLVFGLTSSWWTDDRYPLVLFILFIQTGLAALSVSLFALFMKISWTSAAATQFTLYMTALNIGFAAGPQFFKLGLDHAANFLLCAGLAALPLILVPFLKPQNIVQLKQQERDACAHPFDAVPD